MNALTREQIFDKLVARRQASYANKALGLLIGGTVFKSIGGLNCSFSHDCRQNHLEHYLFYTAFFSSATTFTLWYCYKDELAAQHLFAEYDANIQSGNHAKIQESTRKIDEFVQQLRLA